MRAERNHQAGAVSLAAHAPSLLIGFTHCCQSQLLLLPEPHRAGGGQAVLTPGIKRL
jgi:hypothetical protein